MFPQHRRSRASKIAYEQLLRPFPTYGQVQYASQGDGDSSYQSFQLKVTKRFGDGGTALLAYTNQKLIDDAETLTPWLESNGGAAGFQYWGNFRLERSLSTYDVSQRMVLSYVVDLPFGRGRKYMAHPNRFTQAVAGGWGLDGILTLQTGFPIALTTQNNNIHGEGGGSRPDFNIQACPNGARPHRLRNQPSQSMVQHFLLLPAADFHAGYGEQNAAQCAYRRLAQSRFCAV